MQISFSALLTSLGIAPKTLPQAQYLLAPAKAQLDSIAALFTAAGLPLEEMLAAGPDSLKAHLASLDQSETIKELTANLKAANDNTENFMAQVSDLNLQVSGLKSQVSAFSSVASTLGISATDTAPTPEAIATAFKSHIEKSASAILAKDGRPPVAHVAQGTVEKPASTDTSAEITAHWQSLNQLATPEEQRAYFVKHIKPLQK